MEGETGRTEVGDPVGGVPIASDSPIASDILSESDSVSPSVSVSLSVAPSVSPNGTPWEALDGLLRQCERDPTS